MPIKFRCAYCNQLMGIARRKAGSVVRCPTCNGQVVVPQPEPATQPATQPGGLFEKADFDNVFQQPANGSNHTGNSAPPAAVSADDVDVEPVPLPGHLENEPQGCLLSTGKVILIGIIVILLLGLSFVAGLLVGRSV